MAINFDLNDLLAFRAVAELSSFRKAAEAVHLSQPAFSRRIDKLERALGVRLLDRSTHHVELTTVGREFERKVRSMLDDLDSALLSVRGVAATHMGEVTVACVPSAANYYLTRVLRRFRILCPKVRVRVLDAGANSTLLSVINAEADFGLNFIGEQEGELVFEPLLLEHFVAACRRDHPLAPRKKVTWDELVKHDLVTVSRTSGNRMLLDRAQTRLPALACSLYETEHITTAIGLVEAGLGIAVVPSTSMPPATHPVLVSIPLVDPIVTRQLGIIRKRGRALSPSAQQLYDLFDDFKGAPPAPNRS